MSNFKLFTYNESRVAVDPDKVIAIVETERMSYAKTVTGATDHSKPQKIKVCNIMFSDMEESGVMVSGSLEAVIAVLQGRTT